MKFSCGRSGPWSRPTRRGSTRLLFRRESPACEPRPLGAEAGLPSDPPQLSSEGLRQIVRFHRYLKRNRIDAVPGNSAIFGALASRGGGCRTVVTSCLDRGYGYTPKWIWIYPPLNPFSTHIFANSNAAKRATASIEKVSPDKISVVYPGVDLERFPPFRRKAPSAAPPGIPAGVLVVGVVANLRPVKDLFKGSRASQQSSTQRGVSTGGPGSLETRSPISGWRAGNQ